MKKIIAIAVTLLMIVPFVLAGCKKEEPKSEPVSEPTKQEQISEPAEVNTQEAQEPAGVVNQLANIVHPLIEEVNLLREIDCINIEKDESITYELNGLKYVKITDERYQDIGDILDLLNRTFTPQAAMEKFPYLSELGGQEMNASQPSYIYVSENGVPEGLYGIAGGKGSGTIKILGDIDFPEEDDEHFKAVFEANDYAKEGVMTLVCVKSDEGGWLISEMYME